jgi:hypothetical protein
MKKMTAHLIMVASFAERRYLTWLVCRLQHRYPASHAARSRFSFIMSVSRVYIMWPAS